MKSRSSWTAAAKTSIGLACCQKKKTIFAAVIFHLVATLISSPAWAEQTPAPTVLIINQSDTIRPWPNAIVTAIRSALLDRAGNNASLYIENLYLYDFNGETYQNSLHDFFQQKYRDKHIAVLVAIGSSALPIALHLRESLWPAASLIFAAVDERSAKQNFPGRVTGITMHMSLADMIKATQLLLPRTRRIAIVGDPFPKQLYYTNFPEEIASLRQQFEFIDLTGLPLDEVRQRVARLPDDTVIFYTGINSVRNVSYAGAEILPLITEVANRPVIVNVDPYLGSGAVGGYLLSPTLIGQVTGETILRVLAGESASNIPIREGPVPRPTFDWRQLERWNISPTRLPLDSDLRFRAPTPWELYQWEIVAGGVILILQAALITGLILERQRRLRAEKESRTRFLEVIHLNRTATAGAFSASIAHELKQPLGAILANAETGKILLSRPSPDLAELTELIADIRRDNQRATDIIDHLRGLLAKRGEVELQAVDVDDAVEAAIHVLQHQAAELDILLSKELARPSILVRADPVHVQQVVLNLALNGMEAMADTPPSRRRLEFRTALNGGSEVEISVSDRGTGIEEARLRSIFDGFYTTKQHGTGLGLAISRSIVETYGGRIWAENREEGGATIRFTLPLAQGSERLPPDHLHGDVA
jgi:signal transduction histidine kinase